MADNLSDTSSQTEGNQDPQIKEIETNEESTAFDVTESESPVTYSDQSSSCPSSELSIKIDKSASITETIQTCDEPTNEVSAANSDLSGGKLPESSTSSTIENAIIDETQISIDSSMTKVKHFTSSMSPSQTDATISNVLKRVGDMDCTDTSSQATCGLSTSAEEFQEILTSSHSKESENKKEADSTIVQAENPVEIMVDSPSEEGSVGSEAVLLPGGNKKTIFSRIGVESTIAQDKNPVERIVDSPSEEESVDSEAVLLPGGSKKTIFSRISVESTIDQDENTVERMVDSPSEEESVGSEAVLLPGGSKKTVFSRISVKSITTAMQRKSYHVSSDSSSGSSPLDGASRRKLYQSLQESVDSSTGAVFTSMDSTSSESSFPDEEVIQAGKYRDRVGSYERAMMMGRWNKYVEERKKKENESESEDDEHSAPAKRPALDRQNKKDDDDSSTPGSAPQIPPQERLI